MQSTYLSSMSWKKAKPKNSNLVTYKITDRDDKTVTTLTQDNISTEKEKEHSRENWQMVLHKVKEAVESEKE